MKQEIKLVKTLAETAAQPRYSLVTEDDAIVCERMYYPLVNADGTLTRDGECALECTDIPLRRGDVVDRERHEKEMALFHLLTYA